MGSSANMNASIFDFSFFDIDGKLVKLENFKGKPLLIVNTASRCGFTPQYKNLQNLFIKYKGTDLTIIAITSNSFNQEYSSSEEIKKIEAGLYFLRLKDIDKEIKLENEINKEADNEVKSFGEKLDAIEKNTIIATEKVTPIRERNIENINKKNKERKNPFLKDCGLNNF